MNHSPFPVYWPMIFLNEVLISDTSRKVKKSSLQAQNCKKCWNESGLSRPVSVSISKLTFLKQGDKLSPEVSKKLSEISESMRRKPAVWKMDFLSAGKKWFLKDPWYEAIDNFVTPQFAFLALYVQTVFKRFDGILWCCVFVFIGLTTSLGNPIDHLL